jgi:Family of unknown function (DUF6261)
MKELHRLQLTALSNLEFGQHIKSVTTGINKNTIADAILKNYLSKIAVEMASYDKAQLQIQKSDETAKIVASDHIRDIAISAFMRQLSVYELSEVETEVLAHTSLNNLLKTYKGIQTWNFEEQSNGVDKLIADLNNDKYLPSVSLLKMNDFVTRIVLKNESFKIIFAGRTQEVASKEVFDSKKLRASCKTIYNDMIVYVLSMAKAQDTPEFNTSLDLINAVRKYYSDLLAKRKPATATVPAVAIPAMS